MKPEELLKVSRNTPTVVFHKFVLLSKGRENDLFCFMEGTDCQYYSLRVKQFIQRNYHPISCGNKSSVINTYNLIEGNTIYKKYKTAFFVDSDFDLSLSIPEIYETPCYSVENLYANKYTLIEILKNEFGLIEEDEEFQKIMEIFESEFGKFNNETLLFNAWYATLKKEKLKKQLKTTGVNLNEKLPKEFMVLKIGSIKSNYDLQKIENLFPDAIKVSIEEVAETLNALKNSDLTMSLRGKYQMWFFTSFLQYLVNDSNVEHKILRKKTKFKIDKALVHSQLCHYALTPDCLKKYLNSLN